MRGQLEHPADGITPDAPKFKLAAVSVPRNAREARERARDHVRVR